MHKNLLLLPLTAAALFVAGCDTPAHEQAKYQAQQEEERKSTPPMDAQDVFFDGQIVATISLMSGILPPGQRPSNVPGSKGEKKTNSPAPFLPSNPAGVSIASDPSNPMSGTNTGYQGLSNNGYSGANNPYANNGNPYANTNPYSSGGFGPDQGAIGTGTVAEDTSTPPPPPTREEMEALLALKAESPMPPLLLRLFIKNTTEKPIQVEFVDFDSQLGNFALQPEKITVAPGATVHPNNVISRLGLTSYAIPVTVTLRVNGKKETKVMKLHLVPSAKPAN